MPDTTRPEFQIEQVGEWTIRYEQESQIERVYYHGEPQYIATPNGVMQLPLGGVGALMWDVIEKLQERMRLRNDARIDEGSNI